MNEIGLNSPMEGWSQIVGKINKETITAAILQCWHSERSADEGKGQRKYFYVNSRESPSKQLI